jgi:hypothetical protein
VKEGGGEGEGIPPPGFCLPLLHLACVVCVWHGCVLCVLCGMCGMCGMCVLVLCVLCAAVCACVAVLLCCCCCCSAAVLCATCCVTCSVFAMCCYVLRVLCLLSSVSLCLCASVPLCLYPSVPLSLCPLSSIPLSLSSPSSVPLSLCIPLAHRTTPVLSAGRREWHRLTEIVAPSLPNASSRTFPITTRKKFQKSGAIFTTFKGCLLSHITSLYTFCFPPFPGGTGLAQLVERQPFKLVVVGSSPTSGVPLLS